MTNEYESFIKTQKNEPVKELSEYKTLHDLKNEIESYVTWFNQRSQKTVLTYSHEFNASQSLLRCVIANKQYSYEEIQLTAYATNKSQPWSIDSSFIKGDPSDAISESVYTLDNIDSLKGFSQCLRNHLMDIVVDEETGLRC
ncbi:IS3 family transposase [Gammaproteobacteria bacterium]|nr:IS3 family transposase [Gammaproteobacteria bacterium]MDC1525184.1 IS3 family transposase [Gammaproteobacteria bacterium]